MEESAFAYLKDYKVRMICPEELYIQSWGVSTMQLDRALRT